MEIKQTERGFALLLSIIISTVVLSIGLTILSVTLKQLALSTSARESETAFHMANLGLECVRHFRNEYATALTSENPTVINSLNLECQSQVANPVTSSVVNSIFGGNAQQTTVQYELEIPGTPGDQCVRVRMDMFTSVTTGFTNYEVGRINTSCETGDKCTVVIAQGFNRECGSTDIFNIQRELTAEF